MGVFQRTATTLVNKAGKTLVDLVLNANSNNPIANSAATAKFNEINADLTANDNLKFRFATDGEGNHGYLGADDSFIPFKNGSCYYLGEYNVTAPNPWYSTDTPTTINIKNLLPSIYNKLSASSFLIEPTNISFGAWTNTATSGSSNQACNKTYNANTGILSLTRYMSSYNPGASGVMSGGFGISKFKLYAITGDIESIN